ncbi:ubiquitin carboxyl-terminal hydrolase 25-like isoform X2 [Equus asinus]|uniref:ubiquitin carboxyl-terminal hydrolase 25-like isoform X2 n=1 Tax=Equus asinus TaxID=9793 RepID=UPI0038F7640E
MPTRTRCATIEQSKNGSKDKRDLDVIDLTGDDKDDLQRAIALSLAESNRAFRETGMTDEEQAISRVLEASIAENKACLKRTPTEVWRDSRNPYDRKRQDKAPVGLKNVGNTCWFSAVIQSLFNLLDFRRLVLNYKPPSHAQDLPRNQKEDKPGATRCQSSSFC